MSLAAYNVLIGLMCLREVALYFLTICDNEPIEDPTPEQIENAIKNLPGGNHSFVILEARGHGTRFVQAAGSVDEGYLLEYQEGVFDNHFRCTLDPTNADTVTRTFLEYYREDPDWKSKVPWRKLGLDSDNNNFV